MIRALLVDPHPVVCSGLRQILEAEPDMAVDGQAGSLDEALALLARGAWDVVILEPRLGGAWGLDAVGALHEADARVAILVFSTLPEDTYGPRALRAGADGFLHKEAAPHAVTEAVRKVAAGGKFVSPAVAERLALALGHRPDDRAHAALSERELQVLVGLGHGKSQQQIAQELGLKPKTVGTYKARLLRKLGLRTNAEVIRYAIQHDLVGH